MGMRDRGTLIELRCHIEGKATPKWWSVWSLHASRIREVRRGTRHVLQKLLEVVEHGVVGRGFEVTDTGLLVGLGLAPLFRRIRIENIGRGNVVSDLLSFHRFLLSEFFLDYRSR
jgi:hypothetical protein